MTYSVKECFYTLQGEGAQSGRAAVFLRFAGCNLWSGLERDRLGAVCNFCDTDFVGIDGPGGGKFTDPGSLADHVAQFWGNRQGHPYVVCTGGEPLLQLDEPLIEALHERGFEVAVETNGTIEVPDTVDWICVSPKADAKLVQTTGHELKLVYPQDLAPPSRFAGMGFDHFFLQPMDIAGDGAGEDTLARTLEYCREDPRWRISLQTHKLMGIP